MDSPSQPVNNHHVHSHTTTESKYGHARLGRHLTSARRGLRVTVSPPPFGTERKYTAPVHHTTEHIPEKKFKSEALLSTLTSDASKENTPGEAPVGRYGLKQVCGCARVCVLPAVCHFQVAAPTAHRHLPTASTA